MGRFRKVEMPGATHWTDSISRPSSGKIEKDRNWQEPLVTALQYIFVISSQHADEKSMNFTYALRKRF